MTPEVTTAQKQDTVEPVHKYSLYAEIAKTQGWSFSGHREDEAHAFMDRKMHAEHMARVCEMTACDGEDPPAMHREELCAYCDICYAVISTDFAKNTSGIALQGCGHWFCKECWRSHLVHRIHQGDVHILCPVSLFIYLGIFGAHLYT